MNKSNEAATSVGLIIGVVTGSCATIAVFAALVSLTIVAKRKKDYEKIPLIYDKYVCTPCQCLCVKLLRCPPEINAVYGSGERLWTLNQVMVT